MMTGREGRLFLITTVAAAGCGRAVNIVTTLITHVHVKTTLPGCVTTMICTLEHRRLAQHAERRTHVNRTGSEYSLHPKCNWRI